MKFALACSLFSSIALYGTTEASVAKTTWSQKRVNATKYRLERNFGKGRSAFRLLCQAAKIRDGLFKKKIVRKRACSYHFQNLPHLWASWHFLKLQKLFGPIMRYC